MKIYVTLLSELRTLIIELGEDEPIESLTSILNSELKTNNVEFNFLFNNTICDASKTAGELKFIEDCKVYAVKKNERPLKRELQNDELNEILNHGSSVKKLCTNSDSNYCDYITWKNKSLDQVQNQMSEIISANPEVIESLVLQPQVDNLIQNPSLIPLLYSANPIINEALNNNPNIVKFFNDSSQYAWIQDIMSNSKDLDGIMSNYSDNLKSVIESKRYRRMMELFEKTADKPAEEEPEKTQTDDLFDSKLLEPLMKCPQTSKLMDIMIENKHLSDLVIKNCPYGSHLSNQSSLDTIQQLMPESLNLFKKALDQSKEPEDIMNYLRSNPIEIDENIATNINQIAAKIDDCQKINGGSMVELMGVLNDRIKLESVDDKSSEISDKFENQKELLSEMGFVDNDLNTSVLLSQYGNLDRAVNKLLSA